MHPSSAQHDAAAEPTIPGSLEDKAINTLRMLSVDMVEKAKSGHPGLPLGAAQLAYIVWTRFLKHNPKNPAWPDRDRFILSAGHGSALLYSLLHVTGYDLPMEQLQRFRQWGSKTPGHPENILLPGVECTTGPLGQGFANGVGMALAERFLADRFNTERHRLVDHHVYALVSDGDLMEGVAAEAASLAGHMRLGKLIYLYDSNDISLDGPTSMAFTENTAARFEAYGWHVQTIDGMDIDEGTIAVEAAKADPRPSLIIARTHIGYGSPKQDSHKSHGEPLGAEAMGPTKDFFHWPKDRPFFIPSDVLDHFREAIPHGEKLESEWQARLTELAREKPDLAKEFGQMLAGQLPEGWDAELPRYEAGSKPMATRKASGETLQALAKRVPGLVGGSADLASSNNTQLKGFGDLGKGEKGGRNLNFGVREHAMGSIANGMSLHGGVRPYTGTFLVFSDYMRAAIRLAALSEAGVVFLFTHDSVGLGEDGPTHQPVEHVMALRAIPHMTLIRPADAVEAVEAWRQALLNRHAPTVLCFTRQDLPIFERTGVSAAEGVARGAYVLRDAAEPKLILIATGSEVQLAVGAWEKLAAEGIGARVVSMPSWELFRKQDQGYRDAVLPPSLEKRLSIEAGVTQGWREWVGSKGDTLGLDRFGASAPLKDVMQGLGFTVDEVLRRCRALLSS